MIFKGARAVDRDKRSVFLSRFTAATFHFPNGNVPENSAAGVFLLARP